VLRLRARAGVPAETVRHALTDAGELRTWLAEHAEVDLPDTYRFWGRHTPDGAEPRQRLLHVDDQSLRFSWPVAGVVTTVEFGLTAESADSTIVSVTQSDVPEWADAVAQDSGAAVLFTFWSLAIANLVDHVEGRPTTPKVDFTTAELRAHVDIDASPAAVFDSLMTPAQYRSWSGANVDIEPKVGGRWAMGGFDAPGEPARILELEPNRKVTLDWGDMVSTWELADSGGRTRLTFVHSGFNDDDPPYAGWTGWLGGVAALRRYHELPDWRSIWVELAMPGMPDGILS
jgi:uncharacterized protein YndB with AHSA1/START domain